MRSAVSSAAYISPRSSAPQSINIGFPRHDVFRTASASAAAGTTPPDSRSIRAAVSHCILNEVAVDRLSITVPTGAFYGFLGPNGAGKPTTINILTGLLAPSGGTATVLGHDVVREPLEVKRRIGVVPEDLNLF